MITLIKIVCVNINDLTVKQGKTTERREGSNETEEEQDLEKYGRSRRRRRRGILKHAALKVCHGLHQQRSCLVLTFLQIDEVLQVCNRPEGSRLPLPSPPSCPSLPPFPLLSSVLPSLYSISPFPLPCPSFSPFPFSLTTPLSSPFPSPLLSCPSFTPFPLPSPFFYPYFTTFTLYPVLPDLFPSSFSLPIPRPYHLCLRLRLHFLNLLVSASPLLPTTIPTLSHFPKFLFFLQFACLLYLFYIFL